MATLKYIGHKVEKVRWQPVPRGDLEKSTIFATGSYDDKINKVCLWEYMYDSKEAIVEPEVISQINVSADVTDLLFVDRYKLLVSLSNGSVALFNYWNKTKLLEESYVWKDLHHSQGGTLCPCSSLSQCALSLSTVLTGGEDGRITVLSLEKPTVLQVIEGKDTTSVTSVLSHYQSEVLAASSSGQIKLWDLRTKPVEPSKVFVLSGEMLSTLCLGNHPNQPHLIVAGCDNGSICFCDLRQEKVPISCIQAHAAEVWEGRFHPQFPNYFLTCSQDGSLWQWSTSRKTSLTADDIWLSGSVSRGNVDVINLLPATNKLSVNSFDVESNSLVAVTDGEALYLIPDMNFY